MEIERILCAAVLYLDGETHIHQPKNIETGYVICGLRHHNCIYTNSLIYNKKYSECRLDEVQGFLTSTNRFVDREEAANIAKAAEQIRTEFKDITHLYSENLY